MSEWNKRARVCALFVLLVMTAVALPAQGFKMLHSFDDADGSHSWGQMIQGADGNFYGTTQSGGGSSNCDQGCGTVFQMTPGGTLTTLHSFTDTPDGSLPFGGLVQAANGDLYGVTLAGGALNDNCAPFRATGCGTVFKITLGGTVTILHRFNSVDGAGPAAQLLLASDGNYYGTTGGAAHYGGGTAFQITPGGTLTTLHVWNGPDGYSPDGAYLYYGSVYKMTAAGVVTILHSFNVTDGDVPTGDLIQLVDGNFYGTTPYGGTGNFGTIFRITPDGMLTTLHSFDSVHGSYPYGALVRGSNGRFYTATYSGGSGTCLLYT